MLVTPELDMVPELVMVPPKLLMVSPVKLLMRPAFLMVPPEKLLINPEFMVPLLLTVPKLETKVEMSRVTPLSIVAVSPELMDSEVTLQVEGEDHCPPIPWHDA